MIQSVLLPAENDEESSECLVEVFGSVVRIFSFGLFWNTKNGHLNSRFQCRFALHHFLVTTLGHQLGGVAFLAATEVPGVPIYLLADDRCHSQLNKIFRRTTI